MFERNRCIESGCRGYCCQDMTIYDSEKVILEIFPQAKEVSVWELQRAINGRLSNGVYYQYDGRNSLTGMVMARIVGSCPNRTEDGSCKIHEHREPAAVNFKFGGDLCNAIRIKNGLEPIYL